MDVTRQPLSNAHSGTPTSKDPRPQMRIMLVTDAWDPQVNGVVRTMKRTIAEIRRRDQGFSSSSQAEIISLAGSITYSEIHWRSRQEDDRGTSSSSS